MSKQSLQARSPLDGIDKEYPGVRLTEVSDLGLVSLAVPLGEQDALSQSVSSAYKVSLPSTAHSVNSSFDNTCILGLQIDQYFLMFDYSGDRAVEFITQKLGQTAYLSDQSDSWVFLRISGGKALQVLERICPIDLHPDCFAVGSVARTSMEHLGVIIMRESEDCYLLLSPRSSAQSFLHAVETSIHNIS